MVLIFLQAKNGIKVYKELVENGADILATDNSYCHIYSIFNIRGLNNQNRNYSVIKHRLVNDNSYYHIYSIFFIYRIMGIIFYNGVNLV